MPAAIHYLAPMEPAPEAGSLQEELLRITTALNQGATVPQIVDLLFESLDSLIPFQRIGYAQLKPQGMLELVHVRSKRRIIWGVGASAPMAGSSLEPIVRDRQIRVIEDLEAYYRAHPESRTTPFLLAEGVKSSLTVPIVSVGAATGVLFFSNSEVGSYRPEHVEFMRACGAVVGAAFERTTLADEIKAAFEELKAFDRLKAQFLDNLSHELRTPLCRILTYSFALEDEVAGKVTEPQHAYIRQVIAAAEQMKDLVGQLLDLAALQAGVLNFARVPVDLSAIAGELARESEQAFADAGLRFQVELPDNSLTVSGDPMRLAQALRALLDNARKFTPSGGRVLLRAGEQDSEVWVEVSDTGIGIPDGQQESIFRPFFQVEGGLTRRFGGTGLGLSVARAIARAHGGDVTFRSVAGQGSTFRLRLPVSPATDPAGAGLDVEVPVP